MSKYYQCRNQSYTPNIRAAIEDYYGAGVVLYADSYNVVFRVDALSERVFKLISSTNELQYGTGWTSGATIQNPLRIAQFYTSGNTVDLILGDDYLLLDMTGGSSYRYIVGIGMLSNGQSVAFGWSGSHGYVFPYNLTDGQRISVMTPQQAFMNPSGKVYKAPLVFIDRSDHKLIVNANGTPATINGIWGSTYPYLSNPLIGADYMLTHGYEEVQYMTGSSDVTRGRLLTPLYVEFSSVADGWQYRT